MAYETSSATSPVDLMDKIRLFAIANSIIVNEFLNDGTRDLLSLSFDSGHYGLAYQDDANNSFILLQSTSWVAATAWGSQANSTPSIFGHATCTNFTPNTAIPVYHLFYFPSGCLFVAYQTSEGYWRQFGFGSIKKYGTYTGGAGIFGCYWDTLLSTVDDPLNTSHAYFGRSTVGSIRAPYIRADHPTSNKMYRFYLSEPVANRGFSNFYHRTQTSLMFLYSSPSGSTQSTSTDSFRFSIVSDINTAKAIPIGELPDCRTINMSFLNAGDIFDTDWIAFPIINANDPSVRDDLPNSGQNGIIFRFQ